MEKVTNLITPTTEQPANLTQTNRALYIVGIGASAGGLEALEEFFNSVPTDSGLAFVVVQHLSPDYKSLMEELLSRYTKLAIYRVENGMRIEPNAIYLIPPKINDYLRGISFA